MEFGTTPRIVGIDRLRERLRALLGGDSLVFRRFDGALRAGDPGRIAAAIDALALYPGELRREVEEALFSWLFDEPAARSPGRLDDRRPG